jgi:hypothetical protein
MDLAAEMPVSLAVRIGNALVWLAAAAAAAIIWARDGSTWSLLFACSFALRSPVAFRHPASWATFTKPVGERLSRHPFSPVESILSIVSFVLFLAAIALYASNRLL